MNIQILDSFLRDHITTNATPKDISKYLSLASVSVERLEKIGNDFLYDIEVTTNRVDLMSAVGLARELSAILPQNGFTAQFKELPTNIKTTKKSTHLDIRIDEKLTNRVSAVIMDVTVKDSPDFIKDRLEKSGIRALNNLIDITNYIMREVGHPAHVFDYDRIEDKKISIRESEKSEIIKTLDERTYVLPGGDIVAIDGSGEIIDLLGIMGLENSVVTNTTKRIVLFLNNNSPKKIRKTSLALELRSEAAILNEKGVDPELIPPTLKRGIELYRKYADGKIVGDIIDLYPNPIKTAKIPVRKERINHIIGTTIPDRSVKEILTMLSFQIVGNKTSWNVTPPSFRANDIQIEEDVIEEIARIYGYDKIPNSLPPITNKQAKNIEEGIFYWENRVKNAMKYWGFHEVYTYSMVSEELFEGPLESAVKISNPLSEDHIYMRTTLVPSLLEVIRKNPQDTLSIFEIANIYKKRADTLPDENPHFSGVIKKSSDTLFFDLKGILAALLEDIGIFSYDFRTRQQGGAGADIFIENKRIGDIELLEEDVVNFELDFLELIQHATNKKVFIPIPEYPPIIEDIRIEIKNNSSYKKIVDTILSINKLIIKTELIDEYENKKTFRITYQDRTKNLSNEDVAPIRKELEKTLKEKLKAKIG